MSETSVDHDEKTLRWRVASEIATIRKEEGRAEAYPIQDATNDNQSCEGKEKEKKTNDESSDDDWQRALCN